MGSTASMREPLRNIAVTALTVHLGLGIVSLVLFLAAYQLRTDWFADPAQLVGAGSTSAELLRWGAATDLLSYYLPIAVVAYVLWRILRPRSPLVADLASLAAYGYALAGGSAAAVLAVVGPMLMNDYMAPGADQPAIQVAFALITEIVYRAIWQFLDALLLAGWWLGIGLLIRRDQPRLAMLSFALSTAATIGAVLTLFDLRLAADALAGAFFVVWLVWSTWLLVLFWRRRPPFWEIDEPSTTARR